MTPRFILDENVVILAQQGKDDRGDDSLVCYDLVRDIIDICHILVADDILWDKYIDQLRRSRYQDPHGGPVMLRLLFNALSIPNKIERLADNAPVFSGEEAIPAGSQDDKYLVQLCVETGAILVTTDEALRDDLQECGVQETHHLTVVSPEDARRYL